MLIRPVQAADIPLLSEYWYDNMALAQQYNPALRLMPNARAVWERAAHDRLHDPLFFAAENDGEALGCVLGKIEANAAGLLPTHIGVVEFLILDLHTPQKQQGTGGKLWQALKAAFIEQGVEQVRAKAPLRNAVAQAFWQGIGATRTHTQYWITL